MTQPIRMYPKLRDLPRDLDVSINFSSTIGDDLTLEELYDRRESVLITKGTILGPDYYKRYLDILIENYDRKIEERIEERLEDVKNAAKTS